MDHKKRRQLISVAITSTALTIFILMAARAWPVVLFLVVAATAAGLVVYLRRRGIWTRKVSVGKAWGWIVAAMVLLFLILFLTVGVRLYTDWLWFRQLGYGPVFTTQLWTRLVLFLGVGTFAALFLGGTMRLALRWLPQREWLDEERIRVAALWRRRVAPALIWLTAAVAGLAFGSFGQGRWMRVLRFFHAAEVGKTDPLFHRDLGFYLFRLNMLLDLKNTLLWLAVLGLIFTAAIYLIGLRRGRFPPRPLAHLSVLGVLFLLVKAWDYRLKISLLLYSRHGVAFGAGYADVHARWPAYSVLTWIVLGCAALLLINLWRRTWGLLIAGASLWLASLLLLSTVYPALVQTFRVRPSELAVERPYIQYSISNTLSAYRLDGVEEVAYPVTQTLNMDVINRNQGTIGNIRLWDHRPLYDTYSQLQEIRLYYNFHDVDVERYTLGGQYREVELSVRELSVDELTEEAQTWVNRHLLYTHGYGVVLSPVNETCAEGQPCFFIRDVPPQTEYPELALTRPEIYIGEETDNYIVVGTTTEEFDYPRGDDNVYTRYQGSDGVPMGTFFRRLLFAIRFGDLPILVSKYMTPQSRILYLRTIEERVGTLAPFLKYDYDPYPVILDGKLYWLQDAYTVSSLYPYSEPYEDINYIRNAVKVVVDPYEGTTTFYVVDPGDPLIQTYSRIFPSLFRPVSEMPAGLRAHWRYPEDMFRIQTHIYATYHMHDPQVFYNKEDAWQFAQETYLGDQRLIDSYYVIMSLPGWEQQEFFLMVPFTPANRDNMIAWMHVQCDGDDYGKLGVFKFPKQSLVYGPFQIEARINQDPLISQQLTLWGQYGSRVIQGNLLVIPIEHNLLYVRPLYLQAETGQIPELRRVIVAYGNRIAMAETLDEALRQVLTGQGPTPTERGWEELAHSAQEHYLAAQKCLQVGDWACYGQEMKQLESDLQELVRLSQGT